MRTFVLQVNPEPWAIGPVAPVRRGGKMAATVGQNQQLNAYKEAVREELGDQEMLQGLFTLHLYFWRNRADYMTPAQRMHRKHEADLTNLVKATEDALQGVLFENDRDVRRGIGEIVAQGPDVEGRVVVGLEPYTGGTPAWVLDAISRDAEVPLLHTDGKTFWKPAGLDIF